MSYFYISLGICCLVSFCSSLNYYLPKNLCNPLFNFSGISVGNEMSGFAKPELLLFVENSLWYWPDTSVHSQGNWSSSSLPWNWVTFETGFAVIRRNFVEDITECGQKLSDFFVIWVNIFHYFSKNNLIGLKYNPSTGNHEYDIYNAHNWRYLNQRKSPLLLKDHYLFKSLSQSNGLTDPLTAAFSWDNWLIVLHGSNYHTFQLNQTNCDTTTDLSSTVELKNTSNQLTIEPISSFYYKSMLHFFTKSQSEYEYQSYESANISENGQISGLPRTSQMFGEFFDCQTPSPPNTLLTTSEVFTTLTDSEQNSEGYMIPKEIKIVTAQTKVPIRTESRSKAPSPEPKSNFMQIMIVILLVSIILSIIICVACCICTRITKSKSSQNQDLGAEKDKKKEETPVIPTTVPKSKSSEITREKPQNPQNEEQMIENVENKQNEQKPEEHIKREVESNNQMDETPVFVPTQDVSKTKAPAEKKPSPKKPSKQGPKKHSEDWNSGFKTLRKVVTFITGQPISPDEGKPSNPFEEFP